MTFFDQKTLSHSVDTLITGNHERNPCTILISRLLILALPVHDMYIQRQLSSITHNLIMHVLTFYHVKLESTALEQWRLELSSTFPVLLNLWLVLVIINNNNYCDTRNNQG